MAEVTVFTTDRGAIKVSTLGDGLLKALKATDASLIAQEYVDKTDTVVIMEGTDSGVRLAVRMDADVEPVDLDTQTLLTCFPAWPLILKA